MMKITKYLALVFLTVSLTSFSQDAEFTPNGKPVLRIFSNYHSTFADGERASAFELTRVYIGYAHNFSENLSGMAQLDVGDPGVGSLQMTAYVKNAYLNYKANNLSVNFGLISTTQFKVQESAWGYRYLEKSFQDAYKFNSSADLGVSAAYKFGNFLSADVMVANGEGYKKIEADSTLRTGVGLTLTPLKNFTARLYYDISSKTNNQQSIATFLGYKAEKFSMGAEYLIQLNPGFNLDRELNGISVFTTIITSKKTKFFARYDNLSSNTLAGESANWNIGKDGQLFIAGFEYSPVKGIKLAPNFKGWRPADNSNGFISTIILNCEVKF